MLCSRLIYWLELVSTDCVQIEAGEVYGYGYKLNVLQVHCACWPASIDSPGKYIHRQTIITLVSSLPEITY